MGGILPKYFKSEWSFAQLRITDGGRAICAFNEDASTLIAVTTDGQYYISEIPKGGGECEIKDKRHLINDSQLKWARQLTFYVFKLYLLVINNYTYINLLEMTHLKQWAHIINMRALSNSQLS